MKNTSRKPYIYKVTNLETGQYYIGSQCSGKTIGVNYFTSSTNKEFMEEFKTYGEEKYKITRVKEFEDPDECVRAENYMISDHMQLKDGLCLNRACCCGGEKIFSSVGIHPSEETKHKISTSLKGIHRSEETKHKIGLASKGRNKGTHQSKETRQKRSIALKGIHRSEETRKRMSLSRKGRPSPLKGLPRSEKTKQKISLASKNRIKISIKGITFESITEASKYYNVSVPTIRYWLKTGNHNAFYIEK